MTGGSGSSKLSSVDVVKRNDAGPTWPSLLVTSFSVTKPATLGACLLGDMAIANFEAQNSALHVALRDFGAPLT